MQSVSSLLRQSVAELEVNSSSEDESNITINLNILAAYKEIDAYSEKRKFN